MISSVKAGKTSENETEKDDALQWATFRLDQETYGLNVMHVQEVLRYTDIAPVPGAPSYVLGIINLRGNVVTVVSARKRFGLPEAEVTGQTKIIVIEVVGQIYGMLVDSVGEVMYFKSSDTEAAPSVGKEEVAELFMGVYNKNEKIIILLNAEKILIDKGLGGPE